MGRKSKRKKYNKLVRNKIPQIIRQRGGKPLFRTAGKAEYGQKLKEKLLEESQEFVASETAEEIADILEVVEALIDYKGFTKQEIQKLKKKKAKERGGFKARIILEES